MTRPVAKHDKNDISMDHVAIYIPPCTQAGGAPLLSVMRRAYIRVVTNKIESIGANARVAFADSMAENREQFSIAYTPPLISCTVNMIVIIRYTKKN